MLSTSDINKVLDRITFPNLRFEAWTEYSLVFMRVVCENGTCNITQSSMNWKGRKWRLSYYMTEMEIVNTAFKAVITALEHEAREQFQVDGVAIMDSHRNLEDTIEFMRTGGGHGRD
jgi:hypothetical protein